MIDPARGLFDSLDSWSALERLIDNAESEGPYLECKTASGAHLQPGHRTHLAQAISGFTNTAGGVVVWGISTTRQAHTNLDVLTQIEPIGNCRNFRQQIDVAMPTLAYPPVAGCLTKSVHPTPGSTKGVVLAYVPKSPGDPVQALGEKKFYLRSGAEFVEMPYEILKRMFAGAAGPDLVPTFDARIVTKNADGNWEIPIVFSNRSSAAADRAQVLVKFLNNSACETIVPVGFRDISAVNPGEAIYAADIDTPLYRAFSRIPGRFTVTMKKGKRPRRVLKLKISAFSSGMRAREWDMTIQLAAKGFSVKETGTRFLY